MVPLRLLAGHRTACYLILQRAADMCSAHTGGLFFFLLVIKCKYLICSWPLCWWVSGNLQDEVAISCFTVINRCLSCYLPSPEQALTSSSFAECQFQQGRGIYLQVRPWISWSPLDCPLSLSAQHEVTKQQILQTNEDFMRRSVTVANMMRS